jgi:hypothetical protein
MAWSCVGGSPWYVTDVLYTILLEYKAILGNRASSQSSSATSGLNGDKQERLPRCNQDLCIPISYTSTSYS